MELPIQGAEGIDRPTPFTPGPGARPGNRRGSDGKRVAEQCVNSVAIERPTLVKAVRNTGNSRPMAAQKPAGFVPVLGVNAVARARKTDSIRESGQPSPVLGEAFQLVFTEQ